MGESINEGTKEGRNKGKKEGICAWRNYGTESSIANTACTGQNIKVSECGNSQSVRDQLANEADLETERYFNKFHTHGHIRKRLKQKDQKPWVLRLHRRILSRRKAERFAKQVVNCISNH